MICAGIDAGSRTVKVVVADTETGDILASGLVDQGVRQAEVASQLYEQVLANARLEQSAISRIAATGYGRDAIESADITITEITCHARGVGHLHPGVRTVVDIGGQDSKLLRLDERGGVRDFAMNDRCAAGTGRFLEVVTERLNLSLDRLGAAAQAANAPAAINSMCVVFAETEIIGLLSVGEEPANIVAGVQAAIASRLAAMAGRNVVDPVVFTGGVALIPGMDTALAKALGTAVSVARGPQLTGALGAALLAAEQ